MEENLDDRLSAKKQSPSSYSLTFPVMQLSSVHVLLDFVTEPPWMTIDH